MFPIERGPYTMEWFRELEGKMFIKMPKEQKMLIISHIQRYFQEERGEEIGGLAAEFLLDFVMKQISPLVYNQAVEDVFAVLNQKMVALEEDLHALKMPIKLTYPKE